MLNRGGALKILFFAFIFFYNSVLNACDCPIQELKFAKKSADSIFVGTVMAFGSQVKDKNGIVDV